jgi:hypothetical protein
MIEFILALLLTPYALVAFAILGIFSEHNEARGWAVFFTLVAGFVAFKYFSLSVVELAWYTGAYVLTGVLWSFFRYRRHVRAEVAKIKEEYKDGEHLVSRESALKRLHPKEMLSTIVAWIVIWPFSVVDNLVGDVINFIETLVTTVFRTVYNKIYEAAIKDLDKL